VDGCSLCRYDWRHGRRCNDYARGSHVAACTGGAGARRPGARNCALQSGSAAAPLATPGANSGTGVVDRDSVRADRRAVGVAGSVAGGAVAGGKRLRHGWSASSLTPAASPLRAHPARCTRDRAVARGSTAPGTAGGAAACLDPGRADPGHRGPPASIPATSRTPSASRQSSATRRTSRRRQRAAPGSPAVSLTTRPRPRFRPLDQSLGPKESWTKPGTEHSIWGAPATEEIAPHTRCFLRRGGDRLSIKRLII